MEVRMHTPTAITDLHHALLSQANALVAVSPNEETENQDENTAHSDTAVPADNSHSYLADGNDVTYGTAYTDHRSRRQTLFRL